MSKTQVRLRPANKEDVPFIFNSWLKSYRNSNFSKGITSTIYFSEHHKVIENLLKENNVIVACNSQDSSQVYGYVCAGRVDGIFVLHYIYVKHSFRNLGIGKTLLESMDHDLNTAAVYTHQTRIAEKKGEKYNMLYHPYLLAIVPGESDESKE